MTGAGRHRVEVSRPDKVLFPDDGITKAELAGYYASVAEHMVPHVRGRPVTMQRFPDGIGRSGFIQKEVSRGAPPWVRRVEVPKQGGTVTHLVIDDAATLVWLADQACITPHVWLSRDDRIDRPDQAIFDIDPPQDDPEAVRSTAVALRELLAELGLAPFVKSTGSRGLHVVVVLDRSAGFDEVRRFTYDAASLLVARNPEALSVDVRRGRRSGRVYIDVLRNGYAQTVAAPYAVRPLPGAPVAMPLRWDEVEHRAFHPRGTTIHDVADRLRAGGDPWAGMARHRRSLREPRRRLDALRQRVTT